MSHASRFLLLAALIAAGGCGRQLALQPSDSESASGGARSAGDAAAARAFTVQLKFVGDVVTLGADHEPRLHQNVAYYVGESIDPGAPPRDTIPAYAALDRIQWRPVTGRQVEPPAGAPGVTAAPESESESPGDDPVFAPGIHQMTLTAPAYAGGHEATVRFFAGFIPTTWWAGPDPDAWPASSDGDGRAVDVTDWTAFTTSPAWPPDGRPYFGPDSLRTIPSKRRPVGGDFDRRTFYEIHGDRIYARREGDTVHQDAWIVIVNGGHDKDSPYTPAVDPTDPALPPDFAGNPSAYPVLQSLGLEGSPIGFRHQVTTRLANGMIIRAPQTSLYPRFEPASVFRNPFVAGYVRAALPGRAYVVARAEDSHGLLDAPIADPVGLVARVDGGLGTPAERVARRRVLTFEVAPATVTETARAASAGPR